jgi:hypothetical protein
MLFPCSLAIFPQEFKLVTGKVPDYTSKAK